MYRCTITFNPYLSFQSLAVFLGVPTLNHTGGQDRSPVTGLRVPAAKICQNISYVLAQNLVAPNKKLDPAIFYTISSAGTKYSIECAATSCPSNTPCLKTMTIEFDYLRASDSLLLARVERLHTIF